MNRIRAGRGGQTRNTCCVAGNTSPLLHPAKLVSTGSNTCRGWRPFSDPLGERCRPGCLSNRLKSSGSMAPGGEHPADLLGNSPSLLVRRPSASSGQIAALRRRVHPASRTRSGATSLPLPLRPQCWTLRTGRHQAPLVCELLAWEPAMIGWKRSAITKCTTVTLAKRLARIGLGLRPVPAHPNRRRGSFGRVAGRISPATFSRGKKVMPVTTRLSGTSFRR